MERILPLVLRKVDPGVVLRNFLYPATALPRYKSFFLCSSEVDSNPIKQITSNNYSSAGTFCGNLNLRKKVENPHLSNRTNTLKRENVSHCLTDTVARVPELSRDVFQDKVNVVSFSSSSHKS